MEEEYERVEGAADFKAPKDEVAAAEKEKKMEVDHEFLQEGVLHEIEVAKQKEAEGKQEHRGRTTFVIARSAELGVDIQVDDETWDDMVEKGYKYKLEQKDGWGTIFMAGYLKDIDHERFKQLQESFLGAKQLIEETLRNQKEKAIAKPEEWKTYLAMCEHLKNLESTILDSEDFMIDDMVEEGVTKTLDAFSEKPLDFLEVAHALEKLAPGDLVRKLNVKREDIMAMVEQGKEEAKEAYEKRDYWKYAWAMRLVKGVERMFEL